MFEKPAPRALCSSRAGIISHTTQAFRAAFAQLPAQVQQQAREAISSPSRTPLIRVSDGNMCILPSRFTQCGWAEGTVRWGDVMPMRSSGFGLARMRRMISCWTRL